MTVSRHSSSSGCNHIAKRRLGKKKLSFSQIEIIELPLTLGDSPSVRDGPPVSLCWDAQMRVRVNLDLFEQHRPKRRNRGNLLLSRKTRERILLKNGVSKIDIHQATRDAQRQRNCSALSRRQQQQLETMNSIPTASSLIASIAW